MLVKDIMIKNVKIVSPFATVREALQIMKTSSVKSLIVDKKDGSDAYGIITYTTLLKEIVADEGDIDLLNVYDVAKKPAIFVHKEMHIKYVARLMINQNIKRILVLNGPELEGLISMTDILNATIEEMGVEGYQSEL